MINTTQYPAKLLLFGEYSIIKGSQALAIPISHYAGQWSYGTAIQEDLLDLAQYLDDLHQKAALLAPIDIAAFKNALQQGLYFQSSIPQGYGVGSSGALCAAIYDRFGKSSKDAHDDLVPLLKILAQIESYFHGASSGIDPLVCYLQKALLIHSKSSVQQIDLTPRLSKTSHTIFLLDTGIARETEPLVKQFLQQCEDHAYEQQLIHQYIPLVHQAIDSFLTTKARKLFELFHQISQFQIHAFKAMIPKEFQGIWKAGLAEEDYKLKLCGAGGGGFILGMAKDFEKTKSFLSSYQLNPILKI